MGWRVLFEGEARMYRIEVMRLLKSSGSMLEEAVKAQSGYWCLSGRSEVVEKGFVVASEVEEVGNLFSTNVRCIVLRRGSSLASRSTT